MQKKSSHLLWSFLTRLGLTLFVNCFLLAIPGFATKPIHLYSSIEDFLANQKTIRVFADNSPGFGDQAATAGVMSQLRQMGFKGTFELLYGNVTTDKITTLFSLPPHIPDVYTDEKTGITFIKLKAHFDHIRNNTIETVDFGLSVGKSGGPCSVAEADGLEIPDNGKYIFCDNNANFSNTKTFADFSPYFDTTL